MYYKIETPKIVKFKNKNCWLPFVLMFIHIPSFWGQSKDFISPSSVAYRAYDHILQCRFGLAGSIIHPQSATRPNEGEWILLDNYIDCLMLFISEDAKLYETIKHRKKNRIQKLDKIKSRTTDINYATADIYLQWAAVRFKFGDYFSAFNEVRKGYNILKKIDKEDPKHGPSQMRLAILETLIGTIPDQYQWGIKLIGLRGDVNSGLKRLEMVTNLAKKEKSWFLKEALAAQILLQLHINNQPVRAIQLLENSDLSKMEGSLYQFLAASVYRKTGKNDKALLVLQKNYKSHDYYPFPYLHYMKGECLLRKLDPKADKEFHIYTRLHKGDQYIGAAYQKLGWHAVVFGATGQYNKFMNIITEKGINKFDEDKSALREANKGVQPHPELLKSRLLFDGGYYRKAQEILEKVEVSTLIDEEYIIEYYYRQGRNYHRLNQLNAALDNYDKTISLGAGNSAYYACNAALLSGHIYEVKHQKNKAVEYYKKSLSIKPDEYRFGIHQKAKAGLLRLE